MSHNTKQCRAGMNCEDCLKAEALKQLEAMTDEEFNTFLWSLPVHVQMLVRANMADWRTALPAWYIKRLEASVPVTASDLPF